jgi:FAD/FMN-containing dehydrogenase
MNLIRFREALLVTLLSIFTLPTSLASSPYSPGLLNNVANYIRGQIQGSVYIKGNYHYEMRRRIHNGLCLKKFPDIVAVPQSTDDVSRIVRAARYYNMEISVRSGGHDFLCNSIKNTGIHVDMRRMNKVKLLSPYMAALGPGSNWKRVLDIIPPKYYTMIHGQCLSVGVGGYLTGGGINVVGTTERHGSGAQNVHKFTTVLANGDVAEVTRNNLTLWHAEEGYTEVINDYEKASDLHVAMGMAGSSFGIVTEFHTNIWPRPETYPAIAICYIETPYDLRKMERAMQDGRYHITFFLPYIFHRSYAFENLVSTLVIAS